MRTLLFVLSLVTLACLGEMSSAASPYDTVALQKPAKDYLVGESNTIPGVGGGTELYYRNTSDRTIEFHVKQVQKVGLKDNESVSTYTLKPGEKTRVGFTSASGGQFGVSYTATFTITGASFK